MILGLFDIIIIALIGGLTVISSIVFYRYTRWRKRIVLGTRLVLGPWRASVPLPHSLSFFSRLLYKISNNPSFMFLQPVLPPPTMSSTSVGGNLLVDNNSGKDITEIFDVKSTLLGRGGSAKVLIAYPRNSWVNSNIPAIQAGSSFLMRTMSTTDFESNSMTNRDKIPIHRRYALKIVCSDQPEILWKFEREKFILRDLDHPNIVRLYAVYSSAATSCYLLELCTGGHLGQVLNRQQPRGMFSENTAKYYIKQLLDCVAYCHSRGIVHRDIKLQNILLENHSERAYLKLIDFGNAVYFPGQLPLTKLVGTTYTAAPEVFERSYDEKCDIWSIGVVTYICLCGKRPFNAPVRDNDDQDQLSKQKEIIRSILRGEYSLSPLQARHISDTALDFITLCLKRNYKNRPSAMDLLNHPFFQTNKPEPPPSDVSTNTSILNMEASSVTRRSLTEQETSLLRDRLKQLLPPDISILHQNLPSSPKKTNYSLVVNFPDDNPEAADQNATYTNSDVRLMPSSIDEELEMGLRSTLSCPSSPPSPSHFPAGSLSPASQVNQSPVKQISTYSVHDPFYVSITWYQVLITLIVIHMPGYFLHFERITFSWADVDDDGLISKYELAELVQAVWPGAAPSLSALLFDVMDVDCTGSLCFTEFLSNLVSFKDVLSNRFLVFEALSILDAEKKGYICLEDILRIFSLVPDNLSVYKNSCSSGTSMSAANSTSFLPSFMQASKVHPNGLPNKEMAMSSIQDQWRRVEARMAPLFSSPKGGSPGRNIVLLDDLVSWISAKFPSTDCPTSSISSLPHVYQLGEPSQVPPLPQALPHPTPSFLKYPSIRSDSEGSNTPMSTLTAKNANMIEGLVNDTKIRLSPNAIDRPKLTSFHYYSLFLPTKKSGFLKLASKLNNDPGSLNYTNIQLASSVNNESELYHDHSAFSRFLSHRSALSGGLGGPLGVSGVSGLSWANNSNRNYSTEGHRHKGCTQSRLAAFFSKIHSSKDPLKLKFENMTKHLKPIGELGDDSYVVTQLASGAVHPSVTSGASFRRTTVHRSSSSLASPPMRETSARIRAERERERERAEREREPNLTITIPANSARTTYASSPVATATPVVQSPTNKLQVVDV